MGRMIKALIILATLAAAARLCTPGHAAGSPPEETACAPVAESGLEGLDLPLTLGTRPTDSLLGPAPLRPMYPEPLRTVEGPACEAPRPERPREVAPPRPAAKKLETVTPTVGSATTKPGPAKSTAPEVLACSHAKAAGHGARLVGLVEAPDQAGNVGAAPAPCPILKDVPKPQASSTPVAPSAKPPDQKPTSTPAVGYREAWPEAYGFSRPAWLTGLR